MHKLDLAINLSEKMSTQPLHDEAKLEEERKKAFLESRFEPTNQKYGLFSYTGTLAISSRPYFSKTISRRDKDGKVITSPRNFYTSRTKSGKTPDVYFSAASYSPETYRDPSKIYLKDKLRADKMKSVHNINWKPGGAKPESISLFPHEASEVFKKINKKDKDGKVITEPKNFLTSPPKKGQATTTPGVLLGPDVNYMPEPYDRQKQLLHEEKVKHKSKLQSSSFKSMDPGNRNFANYQQTYGGEFKFKEKKKEKKMEGMKHDGPFYSMTSRTSNYLGKYPEHMPEERAATAKKKASDKPLWKSTTNLRTIPTPSVTGNAINLRSEFPILRNH